MTLKAKTIVPLIALVLLATATPSALTALVPETAQAAGNIIHVDSDAAGPVHDGSSWENAFIDFQQALDTAISGDQIRVAAGIFKPSVEVGGTGERYKSFQLKNEVSIYGSYAGYGQPNPNERHTELHRSTLTGDLNEDDIPGDLVSNRSDNCYHVFFHPDDTSLDSTAILDGFTITGGHAYDVVEEMLNQPSPHPMLTEHALSDIHPTKPEEGMMDFGSSATQTKSIFSDVYENNFGGGMINFHSSPTLMDCTFTGNYANNFGGGMMNFNSSPTLINCTFSKNSSDYAGGGMANDSSSNATLTHCTFSENYANAFGAGMLNFNSSPALANCAFSGNSSDYAGGGMENTTSSNPTLSNCTFLRNSGNEFGGGIVNDASSNPTLTNCVLWQNTAAYGNQIFNSNSTPIISYSDVQGSGGSAAWDTSLGTDLGGNIDADPLFYDPAKGDFRLTALSPCADAGDNSAMPAHILTDFEGDPRFAPNDYVPDTGSGTAPIVDMGADEWTVTTGPTAPVPEFPTLILLSAGLLGVVGVLLLKRKKHQATHVM